jgi:signal peptidase I
MFKIIRYLSHLSSILALVVAMPLIFFGVRELGKNLGLVAVPVSVFGTGSMYPSLYWDKAEGGPDDSSDFVISEYRLEPRMYRFVNQVIKRGDIIAFQNEATAKVLEDEGRDTRSGFIKRVIGLPSDTIELRGGYVIRNGEAILEPYIASPKSTFGNSFLADCQSLEIPDGYYLVLGDNRKFSSDSRGEVGLVPASDISFILPLDKQQIYLSLWRDTSADLEIASLPTLDTTQALKLLNQARNSSLKPNSKLTLSAQKRGVKMLETNDFTTSAKSSGYTYTKALQEVGYQNIKVGEIVSHGFYSAEEWFSNLTYFVSTKDQVLDPEYQEIGIAVVSGEVESCPTQVIVTHLGGYVPATYDSEVLSSWIKLKDNLESVLPSWEKAQKQEDINQAKLKELLDILRGRLALAQEIVQTMQNKAWLTESQQARIKEDQVKSQRAEELIQELN